MRSFITLFSLLFAVAPLFYASPVPQCTTEICGSEPYFNSPTKTSPDSRSLHDRTGDALTNAQRFARGLPPKKPKHVRGSPVRRAVSSATAFRGYIQVNRADGTGTLGYISQSSFSGAQTRYEPGIGSAMIVDFRIPMGQTSASTLDITFESSDLSGGYTHLGLVQGRDDDDSTIASGSYQYLYIAGTAQTSPNATPQSVGNSYSSATGLDRTSESAVWTFNANTNALSVQWVNPDGSKPATYQWTQSTALYAGGDAGQFNSEYPAAIIAVTYKFISI